MFTPELWIPGQGLPPGARAEAWLREQRQRERYKWRGIRDPRLPEIRPWRAAFGDVVGTPGTGTGVSGEATVTFAAATAGNVLGFSVARSAVTATSGAPGNISGWTLGPAAPWNSGNMAGALWWKIAAGGETSVTTASTDEAGNWCGLVVEYAGPFDATPFDDEDQDNTNISTPVVAQGSGTATGTASSALAIAPFAIDNGSNFGTRQYSNSFTEAGVSTSGGRAGTTQARLVLTGTGSFTTTLSYSAGGGADEMWGGIIILKAAGGAGGRIFKLAGAGGGLVGPNVGLVG